MSELLVNAGKVGLLAVTGVLVAVAGVWAVLQLGLLLGYAGPFFGVLLLGYSVYYLRALL